MILRSICGDGGSSFCPSSPVIPILCVSAWSTQGGSRQAWLSLPSGCEMGVTMSAVGVVWLYLACLGNVMSLAGWKPPFQRFGEASKPGPGDWRLHDVDVSSCLQVGTLNAGALLHKEDLLASLGRGIWTASETHHTAKAVPIIKGRMHQRGFHMQCSNPVLPYSTGVAQLKGLASGAACFTDLPIRSSPGLAPLEVRDSSRFLQSFVQVSTHCVVQIITLYGPPVSSAHCQPLRATSLLLEAAFQAVTAFNGPSVISGDLNTTLDTLPAWALLSCWTERGGALRHSHNCVHLISHHCLT